MNFEHVKITINETPSFKSEVIHQFNVLDRYRNFGYKKEDFPAENERNLIDVFSKLSQEEQDIEFNKLETEFFNL